MASQPQEIAPGVFYIEAGKGITRSNVYFVRSGSSWVLIDTASAHCGPVIQGLVSQACRIGSASPRRAMFPSSGPLTAS